jgi:tRNA modification GTPase
MYYSGDNETIVALATVKGKSALAIIRISGKDSVEIIKNCLIPQERFKKAAPKKINLYQFIDSESKKIIDEITAIKYEFPESYTGENMVEILCHGSEIVIEEILSNLIKNGARFAKKGEFTRRAYLNGKIDLLKAESISEIINSNNRAQYVSALEMYSGRSKKVLFEWKKEIINILAEIEARIEFPEEDDIIEKQQEYKKRIEKLFSKIDKEIIKREKATIIDSGCIIPIVGIANAGKSSLFNIIMGFYRTIVDQEEGTTRDAVSEEVIINGERVKIVDTAGLNETKNKIELIGIQKTWEYIENANLIILVTPADQQIKDQEKKIIKQAKEGKVIAIISKIDMNRSGNKEKYFKDANISYIETCLVNENERNRILKFLGSHIETYFKMNDDKYGIICNKRHEDIFLRINKKGKAILEKKDISSEEIISYELKGILQDFEEFVGETSNEEILESIFSEFCIGK